MKWLCTALLLILLSCQNEQQKKKDAFDEYHDALPKLQLPISMRCGVGNEQFPTSLLNKGEFGPSSCPVYGKVVDKPNLKVILYGFTGDDIYPWLYSFDSLGSLIDSTMIYTSNCQADPWWKAITYTTIHKDMRVTMRDTGAYYHWDETKEWEDRTFNKAIAHKKEIQMSNDGRFNVKVTTSKQLSLKELGKNPLWKP